MLSLLTASLTLLTITFLRLLYILPFTHRTPPPTPSKNPKHLMILLGSGGHTAEMLLLLADLKHTSQYLRTYICTSGDAFSVEKAHAFEAAQGFGGEYQITCIPRARYVRQSIFTTPWDVAKCAWGCVLAFFEPGNRVPDVLVMNGPGTAVVMTVVVLMAKVSSCWRKDGLDGC